MFVVSAWEQQHFNLVLWTDAVATGVQQHMLCLAKRTHMVYPWSTPEDGLAVRGPIIIRLECMHLKKGSPCLCFKQMGFATCPRLRRNDREIKEQ